MTYCPHCNDDAVVVVRRLEFDLEYRGGNKYRAECTACQRHVHMASAVSWRESEERLIVPLGDDDEYLSLEEFKRTYDVDLDSLPEYFEKYRSDEKNENEFDCPNCDAHQIGHPDSCGDCGIEYSW